MNARNGSLIISCKTTRDMDPRKSETDEMKPRIEASQTMRQNPLLVVLAPVQTLSGRLLSEDEPMSKFDISEYQSPEWQKKRLEVMEAAGWKCQCCQCETKQLHVHHLRYRKGKKLWEYRKQELRCFCEKCHKDFHDALDDFRSCSGWIDREALTDMRKLAFAMDNLIPPCLSECLHVLRVQAEWAVDSYVLKDGEGLEEKDVR